MKRRQQRIIRFQTLTCIRQLGVHTHPDKAATTYTFLAQVSRDLPPVVITLTTTSEGELAVQAHFDASMQAALTTDETTREELWA
jgi:hypothetical protein